MHFARQEFVKFDSNERIRRALRSNVRNTNIGDLVYGDEVFYKRNVDDIWHGPGVVIGSDGKQVTVDHGGYNVRVHIVWLLKFI